MPRVLFNDCYGDFCFSDAFASEFLKRTGSTIDEDGRQYLVGVNSIRCDTVVLQIFDEFGSAWCSGPECVLAIYEVPGIFERYWEIDDYGGNETVRIRVDEVLVDILETFIESGDRVAMLNKYHLVCQAAGRTPVVFQSIHFGDEYDKNY